LFLTLHNFSQLDLHRFADDGLAEHTSEVLGCIVVRIVWRTVCQWFHGVVRLIALIALSSS